MSYQTWYRLVMALNRLSESLGIERANRLKGEPNEGLIQALEVSIEEISKEIISRLEEAERKEIGNG